MRNDKILKILKIYPYVVSCLSVSIVLTSLICEEIRNIELSDILVGISSNLFYFMLYVFPIFGVAMIISTNIYAKERFHMHEMTADTFFEDLINVKRDYGKIYIAYIYGGVFCLITDDLELLAFWLWFLGCAMLVHTGIISGYGILKAYQEGRINKNQAVKFGIGQCIWFIDIWSAKRLLKMLQEQKQ